MGLGFRPMLKREFRVVSELRQKACPFCCSRAWAVAWFLAVIHGVQMQKRSALWSFSCSKLDAEAGQSKLGYVTG